MRQNSQQIKYALAKQYNQVRTESALNYSLFIIH